MDAFMPQLSQMFFSGIQLIEKYGVAVSLIAGVSAYIWRQRREGKRELRYVLFLLLQVRISLNQCLSEVKDAAPEQIDSVMSALQCRGIEADQLQVQELKEQADNFVGSLSSEFFALDMELFSASLHEATAELAKTSPILAHRVIFLSKLPEAVKSINSFAENQRANLGKYRAPEASPEVAERTRQACEELLSAQVQNQILELVTEVDDQLLSLARKSGFLHWVKVWRMVRSWRAPLVSSDAEIETFTEEQLRSIMSRME
ncbi:MAG: hypothetical protein HLX50_15705 [Alteromonadaceae bacterium]|nr:hypothetical protein [Alteromonadaceae bacterium]